MWGTDGWCDRPTGNKCELQKMDEAKAKEADPITKGGCEYIRVCYDRFCRDIKVDSDNLLVVVRDVFTAITQ